MYHNLHVGTVSVASFHSISGQVPGEIDNSKDTINSCIASETLSVRNTNGTYFPVDGLTNIFVKKYSNVPEILVFIQYYIKVFIGFHKLKRTNPYLNKIKKLAGYHTFLYANNTYSADYNAALPNISGYLVKKCNFRLQEKDYE